MAATSASVLVQGPEAGVLRLVLARPEKKNALDPPTLVALAEAVEAAGRTDDVRVVVLAAQGDVFSGGGDIEVMRATQAAADVVSRLRAGLSRLVLSLHGCPKPVVAEVQGNAYGAGAILAFQCDLPVVADEASFALSFRHVGLIPDTGATWLLPRRLGLPRAKHLAWTGAPFSAADAVQWGLALKSVPRLRLSTAVDELAAALVDGPTNSMGLAKQAFHANSGAELPAALDREARLQARAFLGAEHREGREAFFARRKPDFRTMRP